MAWTASIVQKGIVDKAFLVGVSYTNGSFQFVETMDMTGGTLQTLSDRVAGRINILETTQALMPSVTVGPFTPQPSTTNQPLQTFLTNYQVLKNAKLAADLGVMSTTDAAYSTALTNAKNTFDPTFLAQF